MKLLVFAHTPPPHHGQSYMVKLMLEGFGGDQRATSDTPLAPYGVRCFHVNARLAASTDDMGQFTPRKMFALLSYCFQAIYCRFRYGIKNFYYIPAPPVKGSVLRDWVVMVLCRPFFPNIIFHWHASGLGHWLPVQECKWLRRITNLLHSRAKLSIVLSSLNRADAEKFRPEKVVVVNNGIPDPCPEFETRVLPLRIARGAAIRQALESRGEPVTVRVLFFSLCMKEKGLHDAVEAVHLANQKQAAAGGAVRFHLTVAGKFFTAGEEEAFHALVRRLGAGEIITYAGFLSGEQKQRVLLESDLLCFPTYYSAEAQPVAILEAMACGLPVVTTRWRSIPEFFPPTYPGLVEIKSPRETAQALTAVLQTNWSDSLRKRFLEKYTLDAHLEALAKALRSVEP